jgi:hypothetical protein
MYTIVKVFAIAFLALQFSFTGSSSTSNITTAVAEDGGDDIRSKTEVLVLQKLVTPYKAKVKDEGGERRKFSRCPSGYRYYATELATSEGEYSYGEFKNYVGCNGQEICNYRARLSDNRVEVLQSEGGNYIAADLWLNSVTASIK